MAGIVVTDLAQLPPHEETDKGGAHGKIVQFDDGNIGKVFEKEVNGGVCMEAVMEIVARDRCGNDPNTSKIVPILAVHNTPESVAVVMPRVGAMDLFDLAAAILAEDMQVPPMSAVCNIVRDMVIAVCGMHVNGMMNRDIKDANFLVKDDGSGALLCDFTLSTVFQHVCGDPFVPYTVNYRPPEVTRYAKRKEEQLDYFSCDIYVLGMIIARLLMISRGDWHKKPHIMPKLSDVEKSASFGGGVRDMLLRMMHPTPSERPTARQVMEGLVWFMPGGYSLPKPFECRPKVEVPDRVSDLVGSLCGGMDVAIIATDVLNSIGEIEGMSAKRKVLMCVALAMKLCENLNEIDLLNKSPCYEKALSDFADRFLHSPEAISALHRCIDCRPQVRAVEKMDIPTK